MKNVPRDGPVAWGWGLTGLALIALQMGVLLLSPGFLYGSPILECPTYLAVALMMSAGAVYVLAVVFLPRSMRAPPHWWLWMIGVGLAMRALMIPSTPILEDDYFRYLWDGGMVANGNNPFVHAPADIQRSGAPDEILALARESGVVVDRINHPALRTIALPIY